MSPTTDREETAIFQSRLRVIHPIDFTHYLIFLTVYKREGEREGEKKLSTGADHSSFTSADDCYEMINRNNASVLIYFCYRSLLDSISSMAPYFSFCMNRTKKKKQKV